MKRNTFFSYALQHWEHLLLNASRSFFSWLFVIITIIGSLLAFLPQKDVDRLRSFINYLEEHFIVLIVLILLLLVVAIIINWPQTKAVFKDKGTNIQVIIECCDIFSQQGMKVIHVVDTFDSDLTEIISPNSLHGAFLKLCEAKNVDIDSQIEHGLKRVQSSEEDITLPGRTKKYPLGTTLPLQIDGERYCWVAFTRLLPNGNIEISKNEYIDCLKAMWRNLAKARTRSEIINVAVMGNKFVDLPAEFSTEQKIDLMIQTFFAAARDKACCRTLRICVHTDNVNEVDFEHYPIIIEHLAKRPII